MDGTNHTRLMLQRDADGKRMYKSDAELAAALRVKEIVDVPLFKGAKRGATPLYGILVNLVDYNVGADKGGEVSMFDDFDIDYNQYKYLMETRISGALVDPFTAVVLEFTTAP